MGRDHRTPPSVIRRRTSLRITSLKESRPW
jgi:hypothetical protein